MHLHLHYIVKQPIATHNHNIAGHGWDFGDLCIICCDSRTCAQLVGKVKLMPVYYCTRGRGVGVVGIKNIDTETDMCMHVCVWMDVTPVLKLEWIKKYRP